ncbi:hypothetical protein F5050DRAFT_907876 [Lentinula boryana]|uniref:MFS general substrate transporter n=1 Tax=Lentinula boryana TaxID=40481 RepID=A0ABQ8Q161_9AGAR|nr:hypothetical protein F5050DRAFT_907876 [Lentinula boryana]
MAEPIELDTRLISRNKTDPLGGVINAMSSPNVANVSNSEQRSNVVELPPVDKGFKAWSFCASACALETFIWGWNNTYGIFQEFYSTNPPFQNSSLISISAIGTSDVPGWA